MRQTEHTSPSHTPRLRHLALAGLSLFLVLTGVGCKGGDKVIESLPQVSLTYWTVWDETSDWTDVIAAYRQQHPNVSITMRKVAYENYRQELIEAWARDEGPDLFSVPNTAVGSYEDFITPLPETIKLPTLVTSGGCSKNIRVASEAKATLKAERLDDTFVPVVADDVVRANSIYGLPMSVDTLALYYNKDLLNAGNVVAPPTTWQQLTDMVDTTKGALTREASGTFLQSGVALGTATNVNRATDILATLMMQSGAEMTDPTGSAATFHQSSRTDETLTPGLSALSFYTAFANPTKVTYSWNDEQPEAQEAFASGHVAFFLGYAYQEPILKRLNPKLSFGIAPLPQIAEDGPNISYANYWVETVAKKSKNADVAWDFLLFATSPSQTATYLNATERPTALRQFIEQQKADLTLGAFANQLLLAKTWYHGTDDLAMEDALKEAITATLGGNDPQAALTLAAQKVQATLTKPK